MDNEPTVDEMIQSVQPTDDGTAAPATTDTAPPDANTVTYTALGKEINEPLDVALKRASMGYDYAQKMEAYKQQEAQLSERQQAVADMEQRWKHLDDYARENPEWREHVETSYQNRDSQNSDTAGLPQEVIDKINGLESFQRQQMAKEQEAMKAQEDAQLGSTIRSLQEKHPDFDMSQADTEGRTVEYRVLEHATKNGINSFQAAFYDLYHDDLLARASEKGAKTTAAGLKAQGQAGLVGVSDHSNADAQPENVTAKSYDQLTNEALAEYGLGD